MIIYEQNLFGLNNLGRVHGSAAYKVLLPTMLSTLIIFLFNWYSLDDGRESRDDRIVQHPYGVGAFISVFSFLLTFRLNYAYQRYWEGASAVHQMQSKWLDVGMTIAAFHYQSNRFDDIKPPTLGGDDKEREPDIVGRVRNFESNYEDVVDQVDTELEKQKVKQKIRWWRRSKKQQDLTRRRRSEIERDYRKGSKEIDSTRIDPNFSHCAAEASLIPIPQRFQEDFSIGMALAGTTETFQTSTPDDSDLDVSSRVPSPSLFLQELAHLLSLLSGVALSTLRNDMETAESPLTMYYPGTPWPATDPDDLDEETRNQYGEDRKVAQWLYFCLGLDRSEKHRTLYNAARPFGVLGGVSDDEIKKLQKAKGPYAKVALCTMWLQEFITREYIAGSTGRTATPILSRLYQYISDGNMAYNHGRKIAYTPFPFVNAQMTTVFSLMTCLIFPLLLHSYVKSLWFGCFLNFIIVMW